MGHCRKGGTGGEHPAVEDGGDLAAGFDFADFEIGGGFRGAFFGQRDAAGAGDDAERAELDGLADGEFDFVDAGCHFIESAEDDDRAFLRRHYCIGGVDSEQDQESGGQEKRA